MTRTTLALLLAAGGASAHAQGPRGPAPDARPPAAARDAGSPEGPDARAESRGATLPRGAVLEEVSGVVREIDRKAQRLAVEVGAERVTLSLDRNTMVYTPSGLGTVLDVVPGAQIRAGRNAEFLAYWVQVRAPTARAETPPTTPAQGTGPGAGAAAPATEAGAPASPPPGTGATSPATPGPGAGSVP